MRREDKLLFLCTRQDFSPAHGEQAARLCRAGEIDWEYTFRVAHYHGVAPLVYVNLQTLPFSEVGIPARVMKDFQQATERNQQVKLRMDGPLGQVLGLLNARSLDVMMVKGGALSLYVYRKEWFTTQADVDLLIRKRRAEIPPADLQEIVGLIEGINKDFAKQEHIEYDFYMHHDVSMNGVLRVDPAELWANAIPVEHYGASFYINSPEDMLLASCINSCRKRYFRLKSLLDIAEILNAYPGLHWEEIASRARAYQCNQILFTALTVSRVTLGCQPPDGLRELFAVRPARARLIQEMVSFLLRRGNLESLSDYSRAAVLGRNFSWTLLLTYVTYPHYLLGSKFKEIVNDWIRLRNNPTWKQIRPSIRQTNQGEKKRPE